MFRALSTAATGMEAQQTRLDVTANNIANVSTAGFKKNRAEFEDLIYQVDRAPSAEGGSPSGVQVGLGVRTMATQRMFSQGTLQQTENPLDVAIEGPGFFSVEMMGGEKGYTRDGSFRLDTDGRLVSGQGYLVQGEVMIPPDAQAVTFEAGGRVTAIVPGSIEPVEVGNIELALFSNPGGLLPSGHNLFKETASSGSPVLVAPGESSSGTLSQGILEMSNVKVVEEMIDLISGQRAYEINARVIRAADDMLEQASNLR